MGDLGISLMLTMQFRFRVMFWVISSEQKLDIDSVNVST